MLNKLEEARKTIDFVDREMRALFVQRMKAVEMVAAYKKENQLPVFNEEREQAVLLKNSEQLEEQELKSYYLDFLEQCMRISKDYQRKLLK